MLKRRGEEECLKFSDRKKLLYNLNFFYLKYTCNDSWFIIYGNSVKFRQQKECLNVSNCEFWEKKIVLNFEIGFLSNRNIDIITRDDYFI